MIFKMKRLIVSYFIIPILLSSINYYTLNAQGCSLKGKVVDQETDNPIPYVNVTLIASDTNYDSLEVILGTITNDNGEFKIKKIEPGSYNLQLSLIGYKPILKKNILIQNKFLNIGTIRLNISYHNIESVKISKNISPIYFNLDKKVINASAFPEADCALDLLDNVPSIRLEIDGRLTFRGDGFFKIFINGHPYKSGEDKLRQLPSNRIDKIEIITNPNAKYSAEGTAGIINVITKENKLVGYRLNTSGKYDTKNSYQLLLSLDRKTDFGSWYIYAQHENQTWGQYHESIEQIIKTKHKSYKTIINRHKSVNGITNYLEFGINRQITKKNNIDLSINFNPFKSTNQNQNISNIHEFIYFDDIYQSTNGYELITNQSLGYRYLGTSLSFEHSFDKSKSHQISTYLDYSAYLHKLEDKLVDTRINNHNTDKLGYYFTEQDEILANGKINYSFSIFKSINIETGMDIQIDRIPKITSNSGIYYNDKLISFNKWPKNQEVNYTQDIYALYLIAKKTYEKFEYKAGVRMEHTNQISNYKYIDQINNHNSFPSKYTLNDYFPSLSALYNISNSNQILFSYTKRIKRPEYWELIPFKQYNSLFSYYSGNSELIPTYVQALELNYKKTWNNNILAFEIFGKKSKNVIQEYIQTDTLNTLFISPNNIGKSSSIGSEIMSGIDLSNWWNLNISSSVYLYTLYIDFNNSNHIKSQFHIDTRMNNTFNIPHSIKLKFEIIYNSPKISAQETRTGYLYSNISARKGIKDDQWQLVFSFYNFLNTANYHSNNIGNNFHIKNETTIKPYSTIKIIYNFDNQK